MLRRTFLWAPTTAAIDAILGTRPGAALLLDVNSNELVDTHNPAVAARTLAQPGSTVKPLVLQAAAAKGSLPSLPCPGKLTIAGRSFDCTHVKLNYPLTPAEAIAYSCNNYVARIAATKLTSAELAAALQKAGLATRTGLLPNEVTGQVALTESVAARQLQALGEAYVLVTPLGLAEAYRQLAQKAPNEIREGLRAAVMIGTAQAAAVPGLVVAGKTGTALAPDHAHRQSWFAGFAPATRPAVVAVAFLPAGSGGGDAAPIAKDLFTQWQKQHR